MIYHGSLHNTIDASPSKCGENRDNDGNMHDPTFCGNKVMLYANGAKQWSNLIHEEWVFPSHFPCNRAGRFRTKVISCSFLPCPIERLFIDGNLGT